jgi:hypothetical protein
MTATIDEGTQQLIGEMERLKVEEQRLDRLMKEKTLYAPCNGVLQDFRVQPGQWITNRLTLGRVHDTSALIVYAHVQQRDFAKIQVGQKAKFAYEGATRADGPVEAEVMSLDTLATSPQEDLVRPLGVLEEPLKGAFTPRAVAKLKISNPAQTAKLRVGFTGSVKILIKPEARFADFFFNWKNGL